ncbi:MAG: BppU family phage baseplate upper protein [Zhenhengia sp.]|uniref:BppU family phage baseplate upper protein n=1 Tax=Zhenhengia sp. TaxID=2944208 RepID=UPI003993C1A0
MKPKNYEVLMDIYMGVLNAPAIQFTTEDFGMCQITFSLLEDRITPYNLSNCIVRMVINGQQQDCTISDANNGKAEIVLLQSMFTEVGHVFAELQIYDATNQTMRLTTPTFKYTVRKSLMDDNTVQADANYSILQQMILNVSNADKVSSEALKIANNAKAICDDLVPKANTAAQSAQEALDRAESVVTQEELAQKVTLDGNDTKFDFIENEVVKDGLIDSVPYTKLNGSALSKVLTINGDFTLIASYGIDDTTNYIITIDSYRLLVHYNAHTSSYRVGYKLTPSGAIQYMDTRISSDVKQLNIAIRQIGSRIVLSINSWSTSLAMTLENKSTVIRYSSVQDDNITTGILYGALFYEKVLSENEIQHTFSVLNSSPSISQLHTIDSTGKTSILRLTSSEDCVEMSTGRTLREEYMGVLKTMGKEFTSVDGGRLEVNNGIEARVVNAQIKGQTVKCIANVDDRFRTAVGDGTIKVALAISDMGLVKPSSDYTLVTEVISNTLNGDFKLVNINTSNMMMDTNDSVPAGKTGIFIVKLRSKANLSGASQIIRHALTADSTSGSITYRSCVFEGDLTKVVKGFAPFGLVSTEAIISNNGQQYPIYASEEDKANKKVISLGVVGDVKNTLEILEDGSVVYTQNAIKEKLSDNLTWATATTNGTITRFYSLDFAKGTKGVKTKKLGNTNIVCNMLPTDKNSTEFNVSVSGYDTDGRIYVKLENSVADTVDKLKEYLTNNDVYVIYQLETPIVNHIPKELVPTILTHKTNILEVGGKVKASSFKVTLPVDRIAELTARLEAVEAKTNTQPVNTAFVDETYAKSVNKIEEVIK